MDTVYMYVQNINQKQIQKRLKNCLKKGKGGESEKKNPPRYPIGQHMLVKIRLHMLKRHHLKTFYFSA